MKHHGGGVKQPASARLVQNSYENQHSLVLLEHGYNKGKRAACKGNNKGRVVSSLRSYVPPRFSPWGEQRKGRTASTFSACAQQLPTRGEATVYDTASDRSIRETSAVCTRPRQDSRHGSRSRRPT